MNLQPLVEIKNYQVVCQELYNTFVNEPDLMLYTFGVLAELFPNHQDKDHIDNGDAVKFILKEMRNYALQFHNFDTADHPELIRKLYNMVEYGITN